MTGKETGEMMHGLALAAAMCRETRNGCNGCPFHRIYTGCMFKTKGYPARWDLREDIDDGTSE